MGVRAFLRTRSPTLVAGVAGELRAAAHELLHAREIVAGGVKTTVVCVDGKQLDGSFAGRPLDESFLADLPPPSSPRP